MCQSYWTSYQRRSLASKAELGNTQCLSPAMAVLWICVGSFLLRNFAYIYIYVCLFSTGPAICCWEKKEERKSSNAFSLMILFYKDMILYVCMMHLASKLSRAAPIPSCFWFSPLSQNFCLFRLISKKSTSSPQYCSCLPGCRTNWPHSKTLQLFFTFILSTTLQSISDEK